VFQGALEAARRMKEKATTMHVQDFCASAMVSMCGLKLAHRRGQAYLVRRKEGESNKVGSYAAASLLELCARVESTVDARPPPHVF